MQYWMRSPACVFRLFVGVHSMGVFRPQHAEAAGCKFLVGTYTSKPATEHPKRTFSAARPICRSQRRAASVVASVALRERKALWSQSCGLCVFVLVWV